MLTDDLTTALAKPSAPLIDHHLRLMAIEAELSAKPSLWARLGRRGAVVGALVLLLAGGATAATAATTGFPFWWAQGSDAGTTVTLSSGDHCAIAMSIGMVPDPAPEMTAAGRAYLETLDLDSIIGTAPTTADDCSSASRLVGQRIGDKVRVELQRQGFDTSRLGFSIAAHWDAQ